MNDNLNEEMLYEVRAKLFDGELNFDVLDIKIISKKENRYSIRRIKADKLLYLKFSDLNKPMSVTIKDKIEGNISNMFVFKNDIDKAKSELTNYIYENVSNMHNIIVKQYEGIKIAYEKNNK